MRGEEQRAVELGGSRGGKGHKGGRGGKTGGDGERRRKYFMLSWTAKDGEDDSEKYSGLVEKLVKMGEWYLMLTK